MFEQELISLALIFFFVIVGGIIAARFKQPVAIGLLMIGAIIGPNSLNFIKDQNLISIAVEIGTILLLFTIGLEFVIPKLVKIGVKAMMLGLFKIGIIFFMCYQLGMIFHISPVASMIFGLLIATSSTVVIVKILEAKNLYKREEMPILIGILLIEDIISVVVLTFFDKMAAEGSGLVILENIVIGMTILAFVYIVMLQISNYVVQKFMNESHEDGVTYIALALCLGFSALSYFLGLSAGIGAFLAGSIVASLPSVKLFENAIKPYTEIFTSLFFIAMGMMVNFAALKGSVMLVVGILLLVIVSRFLAVGIISYLFANFNKQQMIFSSIAMISVGEFSLLIAQSAMKLNLGIDFVSIIAGIILVTALLMSFSISYYSKVTDVFLERSPIMFSNKPKNFSNYIKILFNELDIENSQTKKFKRLAKKVMMFLVLDMFVAILWARVVDPVTAVGKYYMYALNIGAIVVLCLIGYKIYLDLTKMKEIMIIILADNDSTNVRKSSYILNNLVMGIFFFILAIYSPLVMVALHLPAWMNIVPFALLVLVMISFKRMFNVIPHIRRDHVHINFSD